MLIPYQFGLKCANVFVITGFNVRVRLITEKHVMYFKEKNFLLLPNLCEIKPEVALCSYCACHRVSYSTSSVLSGCQGQVSGFTELFWCFSTAWYDSVQHSALLHGSGRFAFPRQLSMNAYRGVYMLGLVSQVQ